MIKPECPTHQEPMAKKPTKPKQPGPSVSPTCSCLVLCEDVVISHRLDRHNLQGIIGSIVLPNVPHLAPPGVIYVRVSNVHSNQKIRVAMLFADDGDEPLWEIEAEIVNRNQPLHVHTLVAKIPPFTIGKPGRYVLEARYDGVPMATTPINVVALSPHPPQG